MNNCYYSACRANLGNERDKWSLKTRLVTRLRLRDPFDCGDINIYPFWRHTPPVNCMESF